LVVSSSDRVGCGSSFARFIDNEPKLGHRWDGSTPATRALVRISKFTDSKGERLRLLLRLFMPDDPAGISTAGWFRFLAVVISSRGGYALAKLSSPLPKNHLNSQLHRRVSSRLLLELFVLGFNAAGWEFILKSCGWAGC